MNTTEWLNQCREHKDVLREIIQRYYPYRGRSDYRELEITAPNAEKACENIRESIIQGDLKAKVLKPEIRFEYALKVGEASEIYRLLSSTWFGVPESTSCWNISGFKELVNLMDDAPDELFAGESEYDLP